jgi:membrane associated rhomboid family serine protease
LGVPLETPSRTRAWQLATSVIIAINAFAYALTTYENFFSVVSDYWVGVGGFVPTLMALPEQAYRVLSSMFLHADLFHIFFNMYFLYVFGRAVEEALGSWRFSALYVASGAVASIFHTAFSFISGLSAYAIPAIGASGAISGVLGAYLMLFPGTSLVLWIPFFPLAFFRLRASYYLILWFATQVIYGYARLGAGVAFFAHAGGFVAGMALLPLLVSKEGLHRFGTGRQRPWSSYVVSTSFTRRGLSNATKAIIAALVASLVIGAACASSGFFVEGYAKAITVVYELEGERHVDFAVFKLPDVEGQMANIPSDATRILLSRLYYAGLLYDASKACRSISLEGVEKRVSMIVRGVHVEPRLSIKNLEATYDCDGFLQYCTGELQTQVVYVGTYAVSLGELVDYRFRLEARAVDLASLTQYTGMASLAVSMAALVVALAKDKDLALISEEDARL